ncbi:MAG TPA: hypothetical protein EYP34_03775 [Chromatiaceae bacterium]|nr:hypothetical protein [Chromatiaceae bacterium]
MAKLETVTAPLVIRFSAESEKVIARAFPHPQGVVYLDLFWHLSGPAEAAHLIRGKLHGEGPWRVGDATIRVLGCANTDPGLQEAYIPWRDYLNQHPDEYPPEEQIRDIARRLGCSISESE